MEALERVVLLGRQALYPLSYRVSPVFSTITLLWLMWPIGTRLQGACRGAA